MPTESRSERPIYEKLRKPPRLEVRPARCASRKTEIIAMLDEGESVAAVCRRFGVARDTFVKFSLSSPQVIRRISVRRGGRRRRPGPAFDNGISSADKK